MSEHIIRSALDIKYQRSHDAWFFPHAFFQGGDTHTDSHTRLYSCPCEDPH